MALRPHTVQTLLFKEPVGALALAIERRELFTAGETSKIYVWSLDDGRMARSFEAHAGSMTSLTWLSHVRFLASTSLDHSMAVHAASLNQPCRSLSFRLCGAGTRSEGQAFRLYC